VLENGKAGEIFHAGDSSELALQIGRLLNDPERRAQLKLIGQESSFRFDWSNVGESILDIYRMVSASGEKVRLGNDLRSNKEKADRE